LDTPETIITNKKSELTAFFEKNGRKIITKPIGDPYVFIDPDNGDNYKAFTEIITPKILHKIKPEFYLSLFQNFINADYELRVFYLDGEFYATAIINSKTTDIKLSVSFGVSQINMAAVTLPADIQKKLRLLMGKLSLNAGSIDLLQTAEGKTYFLEVNPIGQFEGYAVGLNYYLDEKIADWLIKNDA
jgi:glutathione synthase/RimK-type ligase-like ATP-grasp enzyme